MINFAKTRPDAIIPTKETENAGYDLYSCFDEDWMVIQPHKQKLIPTCIISAFDDNVYFEFKERGSTGTKLMEVRAGVIDSGFRGPWFVCISNGGYEPLIICKEHAHKRLTTMLEDLDMFATIYPYEKAIAQAVLTKIEQTRTVELPVEDILKIPSKRGGAMLGASGK